MSVFSIQYLLLFVFATIPTGIISKTLYGCSLADVDWLHGSAEVRRGVPPTDSGGGVTSARAAAAAQPRGMR